MRNHTNQIQMLSLFLYLVLTSCGSTTSTEDPELQWETLADGSHLLVTEYGSAKTIERCFPIRSGFECLKAVQSTPGMIHLYRESPADFRQEDSTNTYVDDLTGYHCAIFSDTSVGAFIRESISSRLGELRVNTVQVPRNFENTPYSEEEVNAYFKENKIDPQDRWLNCHRVAQLVVAGSFASLSSSDLKHDTFTTD